MLSRKIIISLVWIGFTSFRISGNDWQIKKLDNDIAVYTRTPENSALKELKAIGHIKSSLSSIVALLYDFETYSQWVYRCGASSTLKIVNDTELIHYQTVLTPWPVDNRDFIVDIKITQDKKTKVVFIKSSAVGNYIEVNKDYVRVMKFEASWLLTPQKDGTVEIAYQLLVDPAGAVPAWIVNMAVVDGPFETMSNMKEWVFKEKYQKTKIKFIEELN
jgi:ribosome-associated toxin RatA of RatAB toxin-antitoxin module